MVFACAYGVLYCFIFLVVAGVIFERKEFK
jgi:hypothetical protein